MTHPHRELIIALLDDPTLEVESMGEGETWMPVSAAQVLMYPHYTYRLREKPKPDVVRYATIRKQDGGLDRHEDDNLRLTFSGDSGVLLKAEVIN